MTATRRTDIVIIVFTFVAAGLTGYTLRGQDKKPDTITSGTSMTLISPSLTPVCKFILGSNDGRKRAEIDFCGDKVKYSGDLPVDESAKVFFDAVMHYDQARCDERLKKVKLIPPIKVRTAAPVASVEEPR